MLPILYEKNTTKSDFDKNGLGFVRNCTKCVVVEERNGIYELELELSPTDRLAKDILPGRFLKIRSNPYDNPQIFEIYQTSVTDTLITAKGQHFKYIANGSIISERPAASLTDKTPTQAWNAVQEYLEPQNYLEFYSDINTIGTVTAANARPVRLGEFLMGVKGSMLDVFGGEFHYDNFKIDLLNHRGTDSGAVVRYGSNISSYRQDGDISTVYTHIIPYAIVQAEDGVTYESLGERVIFLSEYKLEIAAILNEAYPNSAPHSSYLSYPKGLSYDFSDDFTDDKLIVYRHGESGEVPDNWNNLTDKLGTVAKKYVVENSAALTDVSVNITIDTAESLKNLQHCKLCDTVQVYFEPLNYYSTAKIVKTYYDCLLEKYTKLELGVVKKNIADLFSNKNIGGV